MTIAKEKNLLLKIRDLRLEAFADDKWFEIVHGVDIDLHRGEVLSSVAGS